MSAPRERPVAPAPVPNGRGTIALVHPTLKGLQAGNTTTALRWEGMFRELGWKTRRSDAWDGQECDLLVALHARISHDSVRRFHRRFPGRPIVVVGTGTDLYSDIDDGGEVRESLGLARRIVVLQSLALQVLPEELRARARLIHQSAQRPDPMPPKYEDHFEVLLVANVRPVKDPLCALRAARRLPSDANILVRHVGGVIDRDMGAELERMARVTPLFRSEGSLPADETRLAMARSHLVLSTSHQEGGSNVISEALALEVPVLATHIPGSLGLLGEDYPGTFPVGDDAALAKAIQRASERGAFYESLRSACAERAWLADPRTELESWGRLLAELFERSGGS